MRCRSARVAWSSLAGVWEDPVTRAACRKNGRATSAVQAVPTTTSRSTSPASGIELLRLAANPLTFRQRGRRAIVDDRSATSSPPDPGGEAGDTREHHQHGKDPRQWRPRGEEDPFAVSVREMALYL